MRQWRTHLEEAWESLLRSENYSRIAPRDVIENRDCADQTSQIPGLEIQRVGGTSECERWAEFLADIIPFTARNSSIQRQRLFRVSVRCVERLFHRECDPLVECIVQCAYGHGAVTTIAGRAKAIEISGFGLVDAVEA